MTLAEKMFKPNSARCGIREDCRTDRERKDSKDLFAEDWEVFVIKHDPARGRFDWFTLCCEMANANCDATGTACAP
jgi:hypothetical protein